MKTLILLSLCGLFLLGITKNESEKSEPASQYESALEMSMEAQLPQKISASEVFPEKETLDLSFEELEKKFYMLEAQEVEKKLDELETKLHSSNLLALANERELTSDEKVQMLHIIRTKAALTRVLIEKTYQELL